MQNNFLSNVFKWLFIGLLLTFLSGYTLMHSSLIESLANNKIMFIILIVQVLIAIFMSAKLYDLSSTTVKILYIVYSLLTGITFGSIFLTFKLQSIIIVFIITAMLFAIFSLLGKYTKIDLSKFRTYFVMIILAIILLQVVNMFLLNNTLNIITCIISILVFLIYTAYDMQKIMKLNSSQITNSNLAVYCAFQLYLDFIILFTDLLQLFGDDRN